MRKDIFKVLNYNIRSKISLVVLLLGLLSMVLGTSYAILKGSVSSSNEQMIRTGNVLLKLTEDFDAINSKIQILSDANGMVQDDVYNFNIKNIGNGGANYKLSLINDVPEGNEEEVLPLEYVKASLEINDEIFGPFSLGELNGLLDEGLLLKDEVVYYELRLWLDEDKKDLLENMAEYILTLKIQVESEQFLKTNLDTSGANKPVLSQNMIPVYYDETCDDNVGCWRKADRSNTDKLYKWYDYDSKMWANSVTVTDINREFYLGSDLGTKVSMDDILTMQVWIPRYKYKVWNYNLDGSVTSSPQEIQITFEKGTNSTGEITCIDSISGNDGAVSEICKTNNTNCTNDLCNNKTYTHPAFTFGDKELKGIWVGKFEVSSDIECTVTVRDAVGDGCNLTNIRPLVKPSMPIWRGAMIGTYSNNIMEMNSDENKYGFEASDDTHMIKNSEWGAIAYLSHSKYGVNDQVIMNAHNGYKTGCGIKTLEAPTMSTSTCNTYETSLGKLASTTGNIYGIYDMSGGSYEYVMGNMVSPDGFTMMSGHSQTDTAYQNSGYSGILLSYDTISYNNYIGYYDYPSNQYYDKYSFGISIQINRSKLGDAIREVLGESNLWYDDSSHVVIDKYSWYSRGGYCGSGVATGIFSSHYTFGNSNNTSYYSSRIVITN